MFINEAEVKDEFDGGIDAGHCRRHTKIPRADGIPAP
jgi:hypothetical protein